MKRNRLTCVVLVVVLCMGMLTSIVSPAAATAEVRDPSKPLKILFIGNSFTHYNKMATDIFAPLCEAAGYEVSVNVITNGGYFLYKFASETDPYGAQVKEALANESYDIVILQEQSGCPVANAPLFYYGSRLLADMVKENGAELWYYQTWGYKEGHSKLPTHGETTEGMEMKLRAAYTAIAEETGGKVAHAGVAMLNVHKNNSSVMNLYASDLYHPSIYGSTLVAYTLFAEIFDYDVRNVSYNGSLGVANAAILKAAAYNATFGDNSVPEEHKVVSDGVTIDKNGNSSDIDISKTAQPTTWPSTDLISVVVDPTKTVGNGWVAPLKGDKTQIFSGIRGDNDQIASLEYSAEQLSDTQKAAIADIGNGVSVIGIEKMDSTKLGYTTGVENLVNGHWGSSYMTAMVFGEDRYDIDGNVSEEGEFSGLITLNFGDIYTFDAIGYMSGGMQGFPQIQKVYVSDDGINWTIVESACYDVAKMETAGEALTNFTDYKCPDPWNQNKATAQALFSMSGATGKYIRIGVIAGLILTNSSFMIDLDGIQALNTRELVVFGKKGRSSDVNNAQTVELSSWPTSDLISIVVDPTKTVGNGWVAPLKGDTTQIFSGIRGDNDRIASLEYSAEQLSDTQKAAIADIGNGVSVIGIEKMDSTKAGYKTAIENLVNGHWGSSYMATMVFGENRYDVNGNVSETGEFSGLITLNFGDVYNFDAIGYMSGSMVGFPQIQKVYVSDDGVNWRIVKSACYDTVNMEVVGDALSDLTSYKCPDPWNQNRATSQALFSMNGASGKYIRIGIIAGLTTTVPSAIDLDGVQKVNMRELVVFGEKKSDTHIWDSEFTVDVEPSCGDVGSKSIHCSHCDETKDITVIPATGNHTAGDLIVDTAATCTDKGVGHKDCTVCGGVAESNIEIPAKGHGETEYIVEIPATAETEGLAYNKCTVCGNKVGEDIILPKTGEASIGEKTFATLEEALDAATTGDVIKLNADVTVDYITVDPAVTLDLGGKNLTTGYVIGFNGSVICGEGKLIVDKDKVALDQTNGGALPVYDGEGYIFIKVGFENRTALVGEKTYAFSPLFDAKAHEALLKHYAVSGVRVVVRLNWTKEGNYRAKQDFTYFDSMVDTVIKSYDGANYGEMFIAEFAGSEAGTATDVTVSAVIVSDTGVEIASAVTEFQIGN